MRHHIKRPVGLPCVKHPGNPCSGLLSALSLLLRGCPGGPPFPFFLILHSFFTSFSLSSRGSFDTMSSGNKHSWDVFGKFRIGTFGACLVFPLYQRKILIFVTILVLASLLDLALAVIVLVPLLSRWIAYESLQSQFLRSERPFSTDLGYRGFGVYCDLYPTLLCCWPRHIVSLPQRAPRPFTLFVD